jgi:hypothetical protein
MSLTRMALVTSPHDPLEREEQPLGVKPEDCRTQVELFLEGGDNVHIKPYHMILYILAYWLLVWIRRSV